MPTIPTHIQCVIRQELSRYLKRITPEEREILNRQSIRRELYTARLEFVEEIAAVNREIPERRKMRTGRIRSGTLPPPVLPCTSVAPLSPSGDISPTP